ncbi:MAG: hypothetical protein V4586_20865 [Pseudomonadota bacterium]
MARQSTSPVMFNQTIRKDTAVTMSSARAGVVVPAGYVPLLAGDSVSGSVGIDIMLKEMPKPLRNAVTANIQAWFVPKSAHPKFAGRDELNHARTGAAIKTLGAADRSPPTYFDTITGGAKTTFVASDFAKTLGLHVASGKDVNAELIDAFVLVYNFRLAAHSSRLAKRNYATEAMAVATALPPAFWPSSRFSSVVPDYERALIVGSLDLDVAAGRLPVSGVGVVTAAQGAAAAIAGKQTGDTVSTTRTGWASNGTGAGHADMFIKQGTTGFPDVWAEMAGQSISTTLADIDKARTTQAFAKLRTAYAGNDSTGFDNDDTIVALLMQGIRVQPDDFKRPWLLDSARVPVGFAERFATDAANLDDSVSLGGARATLAINVPQTDVDGVVIFTIELLPERIDERMSDEWLYMTAESELPNALRDVQRTEPVDLVLNRRVDAKHTSPNTLYGYEPMNNKWQRDFTRLGGDFFQATPGAGWTENRSAYLANRNCRSDIFRHPLSRPCAFPA